jgi:hypothetical protein
LSTLFSFCSGPSHDGRSIRSRIAVEGKFGEGKRRISLDRIGRRKLRETMRKCYSFGVPRVMNLMVLFREKAKIFLPRLCWENLFELVRKRFTTQN